MGIRLPSCLRLSVLQLIQAEQGKNKIKAYVARLQLRLCLPFTTRTAVKSIAKRSKATFGRKALDIRYMLRTFTFMVKSQSSSEQSKMVPWCTNLNRVKDT